MPGATSTSAVGSRSAAANSGLRAMTAGDQRESGRARSPSRWATVVIARSPLFAAAALLPTALVLGAPGTAFGLLALPVALGMGVGGAIALFARGAATA